MFCIAMELIVVLILVLVVGWNYGMGTQLFDWIEQMRKPVVKELASIPMHVWTIFWNRPESGFWMTSQCS